MRRFFRMWAGGVCGAISGLMPLAVFAEGAGGGYRGIASLYYTLITVILIYGVHDVFHNRKVTLVAAVAIPVVIFGFLLPKG